MENSLLNSQCSPGLACGPQTVAQRHPLKLQTPFRVAHVLRKYNPSEWGGTETAVHRLVEGLRHHAVESVVFAPHCEHSTTPDPLKAHGHAVKRFRSFLPVSGISKEQRRQLIAIGGNLMSFELGWRLLREPGLTAIHTHCLNRLGAISLWAARRRRIPLVVTIHGGALDLPDEVLRQLAEPLRGGWEWGKPFGALLRSRRLLELADAVLTCNPTEAKRLREKWPAQRVLVQPHSVPVQQFATDHREAARHAFPAIGNRRVLLSVGRI
ncbi:MAG: glycosyltransferase, partial [Verrucomicrobiota bacterium]